MNKKQKKKKSYRLLKILLVLFFLLCCLLVVLILKRKISVSHWFARGYKVRGVDVSHYQEKVNWHILQKENISFAFIKATEGKKSVDDTFASKWKAAKNSSIYTGAYHFFSFDSDGKAQARHYIQTVGSLKGKLPPVVDFEFYGDKKKHKPDSAKTRKNLSDLLETWEKEYGVKPIIYATFNSYYSYIRGHFKDYPLWIRNIYYTPDIDLSRKWMFWQYDDRTFFKGVTGYKPYVDMDCFYGSQKQLKALLVH